MRSLGDMLADIGVPPEASQQILTLRAGGHAQQVCGDNIIRMHPGWKHLEMKLALIALYFSPQPMSSGQFLLLLREMLK
eukprot:m.98573 g.98573  ORF g.98573 m.98573 type:complete len:79 (+) comp16752_c0_seq4:521-757(+)